MKARYKYRKLHLALTAVSFVTSLVIIATFVLLYGFDKPVLSVKFLHTVQIVAFFVLITKKVLKFVNAYSKMEFLRINWFEIPPLIILMVITFGANTWLNLEDPGHFIMLSLGVYLLFQVIAKACQFTIDFAATGKNPTRALITLFVVLIITGAGFLMLPRSYNCEDMSFVDALFTATSATCVTGLIVKDTGRDFSVMGQMVILVLIQLGGLGIVIFGAVIALLLGQALNVRESVAMQDLLSAQTLGKIGTIIAFIFIFTIFIETAGAVAAYNMWDDVPGAVGGTNHQWFVSVFHSISAFCNAGFSLFDTSLVKYSMNWPVYAVIVPLIIIGGLGFGVLHNIYNVIVDKCRKFAKKSSAPVGMFDERTPVNLKLQTKIVITVSLVLILLGTLMLLVWENNRPDAENCLSCFGNKSAGGRLLAAFFQSVTARTAGFNTVDIGALSHSSKFILMMLMFIGGSPGSTAGGIKTVTLAVVVMVAWATMQKRSEVEMFKRSVRLAVVGRAVTVTLIFVLVFVAAAMGLAITERHNEFTFSDISFEAMSALGTVGLSTGITPSLTTGGKLIIIAVMLIGRLGPLTLLALLTFNLKPAGYNYPDEPIIVG